MKTEQERRAIKDRMAQTRLDLRHTEHCRVLPDRAALLDRMPSNARVAEIGVAFGEFTDQIMRRCRPRSLLLVDAWASERYRDGLAAIEDRFADDIASGVIRIMQGLSLEVLAKLDAGALDWAYIDTNHTYDTTLAELQLCDHLVGPDGRIAGHDFCTGNVISAIPYGVVEAVTKFCMDHDWQFEFLTVESRGHFSFCLKRLGAA